MSVIKDLYQLQLVDRECDQARVRLDNVLSQLGESAELIQARELASEGREVLGRLRARMRALDLEVAGLSDKLK